MHSVRVPETLTATRLEVTVSYPSGPLAGDITTARPVRVKFPKEAGRGK